jgi:hypothetical protein
MNMAVIIFVAVFEFSYADRLIVTSSIFRKGEMDTLSLSDKIRKHERLLQRLFPVGVGLVCCNMLVLFGATAVVAFLASLPFIACYGALSFITYRKQLRKLQQGTSGR